jgi:RNA-directed DNA polymerase
MNMKRAGRLYRKIHTHENLCLAFWKAARGKQDRREVIAFRNDFDDRLRKLQKELINHAPDIGHYHVFKVHDPKQRNICAAAFPERVLHHAVMNLCEPVLEAYAIHGSYACRKGKGARKALDRAQRFARKYDWYLKLDIRKYFDTIDHRILLDLLARRFKDKELMQLFEKLLDTYHTAPGKGMPIGNLVSQHLANFYLGAFDHWIKEEQRVKGYLRYMDDMIVFGQDRTALKALLKRIGHYLDRNLALQLKDAVALNRCRNGLTFLGYRVFPDKIRLSARSKRRFISKFRQYEQKWQNGEWSTRTLVRHMEPLIDFTRAAAAEGLRRSVIKRYGVSF